MGKKKTRHAVRMWMLCITAACLGFLVPAHAQQAPPRAGDVLRDLGEKAQPAPPPTPRPTLEVAP